MSLSSSFNCCVATWGRGVMICLRVKTRCLYQITVLTIDKNWSVFLCCTPRCPQIPKINTERAFKKPDPTEDIVLILASKY